MRNANKDVYILVNAAKCSGRRILQSFLEAVGGRADVRLHICEMSDYGLKSLLEAIDAGHVHGLVTSELENPQLASRLEKPRFPVVVIGSRKRCLPGRTDALRIVTSDEMRIAATGTRHLISCGRFASYGYVHFREDFCQHLSQLRERGFLETLRKSGLAGMRYMSAAPEGKSDLDDLAAWLRQLPKPAAVLVGYDRRAAEVVDCCQRNGIRIPDEVCVLGIDNDEIICQQTRPRLSSVATDNASEGRIAAQQILALLRAKAPDRERKTVYGPTAARIVERETTRVLAPGLQLVKRAQAYIAENAGRAVSVEDVVTHLGVSRRLAYRRFGEFARQPIHRAILEARVAWVKQRLLSSRQTIEDVSLEAGFANPNNLKIVFRRLTGMTMREWRARNARPAPCK